MVLGVCRRILRDWHAAEDAFQATFFVLAKNASSIRKRGSVSSWLYGVAYQVAVRAKTSAARRQQREQQTPPRVVASPEADVSWREVGTVLDEEMGRLPERYRAPLVLCYLGGLTREEAARQLGWAVRTLKRRLERGRELLRSRLGRRGLAPSAAPCVAALSQYLSTVPVPAVLTGVTLKGALSFAGGPADVGASGEAVALADDFVKAVSLGKLKLTSALMVLTCLVLASFGMAVHHVFSAKDPPSPSQGPAPKVVDPSVGPEMVKVTPAPREDLPKPAAVTTVGKFEYRQGDRLNCVALAPVGNLLAAGSDEGARGVRVWDAGTGKELYRLDMKSGVSALAFSGDGKLLAVGSEDKAVRLLDAFTGKELFCVEGHGLRGGFANKPKSGLNLIWEQVSALVFSLDGKTLISGGHDGTVRLWDVARKEEIFQFKVPGCAVHSLTLSHDGTMLAAGCEEVGSRESHPIFLWDVAERKEIRPPLSRDSRVYGHGTAIRAVAFAPDDKSIASGGMDGKVVLWDVSTGEMIRTYRSLNPIMWCVQALAFSPDGETIAAGDNDRQIFAWTVRTGKPFRLYVERQPMNGRDIRPVTGPGVRSLVYSPDGTILLSAGDDDRVHLWEAATGKELKPEASAPALH
jgi:RNA polymerase sigma factor (sigma-70 family)